MQGKMSQNYVDLEEIVRNWAFDVFNDTASRLETVEITPSDIDWTNFRIVHEHAEYTNQAMNTNPKSQVLFTANFINETEQAQVFKLNSERRTTSVSKISTTRALTKGLNLELKLQSPNAVVEANAGFKGEMSITDSNEETFREHMVWAVNNDIQVPPQMKIKAELVLTEVEFSSKFTCKTKLEGTVRATVRGTKSRTEWDYTGHTDEIFLPEHGFEQIDSGVCFKSKGECKCRYGLEQHVRLHQVPMQSV